MQFESGRTERMTLSNGLNQGTLFRLLSAKEEAQHFATVRNRLEEELKSVRGHVSQAESEALRRSREADTLRAELEHLRRENEDRNMCPICLDGKRDTAFTCGVFA